MPEKDCEAAYLQDIMGRLSNHLDKLAGQAFDIEDVIGQTLTVDAAPTKNAITNLQALDFLRQSLEDLALMTLLLSQCENGATSSNFLDIASGKLKLRATRSLLEGCEPHQFERESETLGDLDLF